MGCWSIGVLRHVRIAPCDREVGDAERALESVAQTGKTLNKKAIGPNYLPPFPGGSFLDVFPGG